MTLKELIHKLEEAYPLQKAEKWDNCGLQVGRNKEIRRIFLALDATEEIIAEAVKWEADLLLTHHPLTLEGVRQVTADHLTGRKILTLIQNDLCHYAMHTNYDIVEMGELVGKMMKLQQPEILEITGIDENTLEPEGIGRVGSLVRPVTVEECARLVKHLFQVETVKIFGDPELVVERIAICPGSGKSMIPAALNAKAQILITGDIGHHDGIDAVDQGLVILDAGHYGLEHIFVDQMEMFLKSHAPNTEIRTARLKNPFVVL